MKYKYFLVSLVLLLLGSCNNNSSPYDMATNDLKRFEPDLVSHFPRSYWFNFKSSDCSFPDKSIKLNMGVFFRARYNISDRIDIDSLINLYSSLAIKKCYHDDSCNLLLPIRDYRKHTIGKPVIIACSDTGSIMPVPSFYKELYDLNLPDSTYLPKTYTLYVLGAKPGKYVHENLLMEEGHMPEEWEHGYSKGVAINKDKREAIYWIEIW